MMTETLFVKQHFNTSFQFVPSANMEGEGLKSDTAASHQGENQVFFSGAVLLLILIKNQSDILAAVTKILALCLHWLANVLMCRPLLQV